jgi:hypothetical protein
MNDFGGGLPPTRGGAPDSALRLAEGRVVVQFLACRHPEVNFKGR